MSIVCNLCNAKSTEAIYIPINSTLTIRLCWSCGLLQSYPREETGGRLHPWPSPWADFGGLRTGKLGRVDIHLRELVKLSRPQTILDVGANRGHFVNAAMAAWPQASITAIEPDTSIVEWHQGQCDLDTVRLEQFKLGKYDLIYLSHTLEHLPDPLGQLKRLARALGGVILIEVPNTVDILQFPDVIEEMFIDRHLYHFTPKTLTKMVYAAGLRIIHNLSTPGYITLMCAPGPEERLEDDNEPRICFEMVKAYEKRLVKNHNRLTEVVGRLNRQLETQTIAAYGAGRIYQAFVEFGLHAGKLAIVCDRNLAGLIDGVADPAALAMALDKVVIFSRESAEEMQDYTLSVNPGVEVIEWTKL